MYTAAHDQFKHAPANARFGICDAIAVAESSFVQLITAPVLHNLRPSRLHDIPTSNSAACGPVFLNFFHDELQIKKNVTGFFWNSFFKGYIY